MWPAASRNKTIVPNYGTGLACIAGSIRAVDGQVCCLRNGLRMERLSFSRVQSSRMLSIFTLSFDAGVLHRFTNNTSPFRDGKP